VCAFLIVPLTATASDNSATDQTPAPNALTEEEFEAQRQQYISHQR